MDSTYLMNRSELVRTLALYDAEERLAAYGDVMLDTEFVEPFEEISDADYGTESLRMRSNLEAAFDDGFDAED